MEHGQAGWQGAHMKALGSGDAQAGQRTGEARPTAPAMPHSPLLLCFHTHPPHHPPAGTPLQNNLKELWSLLSFIMPDVFRVRYRTAVHVCAALAKGLPCDTAGAERSSMRILGHPGHGSWSLAGDTVVPVAPQVEDPDLVSCTTSSHASGSVYRY